MGVVAVQINLISAVIVSGCGLVVIVIEAGMKEDTMGKKFEIPCPLFFLQDDTHFD